MKHAIVLIASCVIGLLGSIVYARDLRIEIPLEVLQDKIKGGWAGQTIACTYGGPTEFQFRSMMIPDYHEIPWYDGYMKEWYEERPWLYDDIYMDLTFVEVFEREGLDAPARSFAEAFAHADYYLWHANQCARYNILNGILPPESGHWLNNPCADDIDFQIEADFAGLMSPGMVNSSAGICDKIGHIMNYGDGWYGGVYVAAMYALAIVSDDINHVIEDALKVIPAESKYALCMRDVINWHTQNPDNWKVTWLKVHDKWNNDVGCPHGIFNDFNIDAKINSAWILLGLLYGEKDFGKTIDISTRCGDDSDCNPASAGGILGTMIGYDNIPDYWKQGLAEVESIDFQHTTISLDDVYDMSYRQALEVIRHNDGEVNGEKVSITLQTPVPVQLEVGFKGHYPFERKELNTYLNNEVSFEFEGIGFAVNGGAGLAEGFTEDYTFNVEMYIDGYHVGTSKLPTNYTTRAFIPFWKYQLPLAKHEVRLRVMNPTYKAGIYLTNVIIYGPSGLEYVDEHIPSNFTLSQNYPNPFNPVTTIEFSLPRQSFVTLKVYNIMGEEVVTLVSRNLVAGNHRYTWNFIDLASGVYYYRLQAGFFEATKKLLLVR